MTESADRASRANEGDGSPRFVAEISLGNALRILTLICGIVGHFAEVIVPGTIVKGAVDVLKSHLDDFIGA